MAERAVTIPRKTAVQARSRATVDAILEATARILVRDGYDRASTNRIADKAGVSIGSLYQYFPGKEALVAAVINRHNRDLMAVVGEAFAGAAGKPLAEGLPLLVEAAIEAHGVDPDLHRVLAEQTPRSGVLAGAELFQRDAYALFEAWLGAHRDEIAVDDVELAAFVCVSSIEAVTHTAVIHRPDLISHDRASRLVEQTTRLILGYLTGAGEAASDADGGPRSQTVRAP
jgi:AcrR family transcriptional regulator